MRNPFRVSALGGIWSQNLVLLASSLFMMSLGQGLINGASTNFFVDVLGLGGSQVLWLAGVREIPGLILVFIAALIMYLPLSHRAAASLLLMGIGYGLYAVVNSYVALLAMAVVASLGFHTWMPLHSSLALSLAVKEQSGRVMGSLSAVGALASLAGMGVVALFALMVPLRGFFLVGGAVTILAGVLVARIPRSIGDAGRSQKRILFKRRYWLYYVLTLFEGSRTQVFGTFGTLILVRNYGLDARQISLILLASGLTNLLMAPRLGRMLDLVGERVTLSVSYVLLALCFIGYATVHNAWFLAAMLIGINLLVTLSIGLSTYVNRIAPPEELTPTLSAGVSVNHITSVGMSLLAGSLLQVLGYERLCYAAAAIILASVPFALSIRVRPPAVLQPAALAAE
ncbi:MAG: MFS transporter [Anaerolineae bacterium]